MKREIKDVKHVEECCPGHDNFPSDTHKNNRSKRARARDIAKEHRYVRRTKKRNLLDEIKAGGFKELAKRRMEEHNDE